MAWLHREIEIVAIPMGRGLYWERNRHKGNSGAEDGAQAERIAELMSKPTMTTGEAMAGLPVSPLQRIARTAADAPREPSRIELNGDRLTIFFPSNSNTHGPVTGRAFDP